MAQPTPSPKKVRAPKAPPAESTQDPGKTPGTAEEDRETVEAALQAIRSRRRNHSAPEEK